MPLITDIATVKQYVKVMFNSSNASLADMTGAEIRFLVPILGQTLYAALLATPTTPPYDDLAEYCKRAVAPLAYWTDLPTLQTQISDGSVGTFVSNNMQAAHRWEFEELSEALADKGCFALENLLQFLFDNAADYSWTVPLNYDLIFLTGKEFNKYYNIYQPYRTFEMLRPLLREVEDQEIRSIIGDGFFEELRDNDAPNDDEKKVIELIKKAVASLTIKKAVERLPVKISAFGFTVMLSRNPDRAVQGEENAPTDQMSLLHTSVKKSGESYLVKLKDLLNANASDSVFATYFASDFYQAPIAPENVVDPNSTRKIFGL
jgi:hypothetical protein